MLQRFLRAAAVLSMAGLCALSAHATDVGVSVHVNQPGLYGRVDIGRVPTPPLLVYPQPVVIAQPPVIVERAPIYLHVPPGHAKNWRKHCGRYNACSQPVYFVRDDWYQQQYAPRVYRTAPPAPRYVEDRRGPPHGPKGHGPDHRGPGKGPGNGKGHGPEHGRGGGPGKGHGPH